MRPAEFWCSTLPEVHAFIDGSRLAQRDSRDLIVTGAWYVAALSRGVELPDLAEMLTHDDQARKRRPRLPQTAEEAIGQWKAYFARLRVA